MAEGFEAYHVPQQSRRDKLRVLVDDDNNSSLQLQNYASAGLVSLYDPSAIVYMDPQSSTSHVPFQEINGNPFLYTPHNLRFLDHAQLVPHNNTSNNTTNGQGLSLSLSSLHQNTSCNELSKSSSSCVPLGPFTGYSLILKRSKFLKPAQLLLEELVLSDVGRELYAEKFGDDSSLMDPLLEAPEINIADQQTCSNGDEHGRKKSKLISMLDEVYQKYKQYHEQLQMVVASFESVSGLGNAAPFANLALKAMTKHFKCLKDAITDQLQFTNRSCHAQICGERDPITGISIPGKGLYSHRPEIHNNQPVWRPQRGLPERAVTVLRAWLFDHFLHPYPTDTDKVMLAKQTGLSRNQVSNWFINARVRLWKPMVEEIHMLETKESQKSSQRDGQNSNNIPTQHFPSSNDQTPSTSTPRMQDIPSKRTRNNIPNIPLGSTDSSISLSYGNLSSEYSRVGMGGGVSLTLGLHQNTGISSSEPFPINAARRFGIDANSHDRFMVGSFEEQNGQFGRNMVNGGQFLHEFAG